MIRELKQAEYQAASRDTIEEVKTDQQDNGDFFTGFKGLFRKVVGQRPGASPSKLEAEL